MNEPQCARLRANVRFCAHVRVRFRMLIYGACCRLADIDATYNIDESAIVDVLRALRAPADHLICRRSPSITC